MNKTQRLLSCVFQNRADEAMDIIKQGDFYRTILYDVGFTNALLPLYKITMCFNVLLLDDNWSKDYMPTVLANRKECNKLMDFWKSEFGYPVDGKLDMRPYEDCAAHFQDWDFEDLLDGTPEDLVRKGYDLDEAMLCYGVLVNKWKIIDEQIAKGTNPDVCISCDFSPSEVSETDSYNALTFSESTYCDIFNYYGLCWVLDRNEGLKQIEQRDVHYLLQATTYRQHYVRLKNLADEIKSSEY